MRLVFLAEKTKASICKRKEALVVLEFDLISRKEKKLIADNKGKKREHWVRRDAGNQTAFDSELLWEVNVRFLWYPSTV